MARSLIFAFLAATVCSVLSFSSIDSEVFFFNKIGIPPLGTPNAKAVMPTWGHFTQRLDHFNPQDNRTWTMRYLNSSQFFKNGGPIFVFIGGEWEILPDQLMTGQVFELAKENDGYMFYTEHRFYGKSIPTKDFSTESFKYLSTDQALEDVAHFIQHQKEQPEFKNSSVVVIGASYSANLATWLRLKYPHLVDIAYASSAPLRAKADFYECLEVVSEVIEKTNKTCANAIQQAISITENLLETPEGVAKMGQAYNICDTTFIKIEPYRSNFFWQISMFFTTIVQYADNNTLPFICDEILKGGQTPFDQLTHFIRKHYSEEKYCVISYDEFMEHVLNTEITDWIYRRWMYQSCAEFGYHHTASSKKQIFGNNLLLPYFHNMCNELFGTGFGAETEYYGVNRTNTLYGGFTPQVSRVLFVQGTIDPWHPLGVSKNLTSSSHVMFIEGGSHCQDLQEASSNDSPQLAQAKRQARAIIGDWLKEINQNFTQ